MINSINSNSMSQQSIWNKLAIASETNKELATREKQQVQSMDTSDSSDDINTLSMEDHMGIMMSSQTQSLFSSSENQTQSDSTGQNSQKPMGPPPEKTSVNYDTDGDGTVSTDEYEAAVKDLGISDAASAEDFFSEYDTNSDGEISAEEFDAVNTSSSSGTTGTQTDSTQSVSYDTDGDGTISTDEYEAAVKGLGISDAASAEDFFSEYDTNSDGEISSDELDAKRPMGPPPEKPPVNYDSDGDGTISTDEYDAAVKDLGISNAASAEDFFTEYDTNSDGEISADEFDAVNASNTTSTTSTTSNATQSVTYDTDGDGTISTDEYEAAVKRMGNTDAASAEDFFNEYDTNSDGELSMDEILAGLKSYQSQATKTLDAYETNYQYMYETNSTNTDSIV